MTDPGPDDARSHDPAPAHAESHEQTPLPSEPEPVWGGPRPPASSWSTRTTVAAIGIAVVIAAVGGGVIYAAAGNSGADRARGGPGMSMNGPGGPNGPGGQNAPGGMADPGGGTAATSLHGQFVVSDGNGGYRTELTQTGAVTALSATSITAQSADEYSRTYVVSSETTGAAQVKVGDTVSIRATETGNSATATAVTEGTGPRSPGTGRRGRENTAAGPVEAGGSDAPTGGPGRPGRNSQFGSGPWQSGNDGQFGSGPGQFGGDPGPGSSPNEQQPGGSVN